MEKKLYYQFSDNNDVSNVIMDLSGCMEWINADLNGVSPEDISEFEYTIKPIYLTDEEVASLPEAEF